LAVWCLVKDRIGQDIGSASSALLISMSSGLSSSLASYLAKVKISFYWIISPYIFIILYWLWI